MFEDYINQIYNKNLPKTSSLGSTTTVKEIRAAELHPALMSYISSELDYLIFKDRLKIFKESQFDYSNSDIRRHFDQINKELKEKKQLSIEYVRNLMKFAASFHLHFLARPNSTLLKFIFSDQTQKPAEEIKQIIRYTFYHNYLKEAITAYIDKKKIVSLTKDDFKKLLDKIDSIAIENDKSKLIESGVEAIDNLFNYPRSGEIPVALIDLFLKEKKLYDELENLQSAQKKEPAENRKPEKIKEILLREPEVKFDIPLPAGEFAVAKPEPEKTEPETLKEKPVTETEKFEPPKELRKTTFEIEEEDERKIVSKPEAESKETPPERIFNEKTDDSSKRFLNDLMDEKGESAPVDRKIVEEEKTSEQKIVRKENFDEFKPIEEEIIISDDEDSFKMQLTIDESIDIPSETDERKPPDRVGFEIENKDRMNKEDIKTPDDKPKPKADTHSGDKKEEKEPQPDQTELKKDSGKRTSVELDSSAEDLILDGQTPIFLEDKLNRDDMDKDFTYQTKDEEIHLSDDEKLDAPQFEIAKLLEHKHMPRILESVFDYDMEDLTLLLEKVSRCSTFDKAVKAIDKHLNTNHINVNSKEALILKEIISKHFQY